MPPRKAVPAKPTPPAVPASPSAKSSWFQQGFDPATAEAKRQEQTRKDMENMVRRFWIPADKENMVIFVDGDPFNIREHQFYEPGSRPKFRTCLKGAYPNCPYDESDNKPSFTGCLTLINTNEWTDKQGKEHKNILELFAGKAISINSLRRVADKKGGLAGAVINIYRNPGDKTPAVGDQFELVEKLRTIKIKSAVEPGKIIEVLDPTDPKLKSVYGVSNVYGEKKNEPPRILDYLKVLAPCTPDEALRWLANSGKSANAPHTKDEEISY